MSDIDFEYTVMASTVPQYKRLSTCYGWASDMFCCQRQADANVSTNGVSARQFKIRDANVASAHIAGTSPARRGIDLKFENRSWFNPFFQVCYANNTRIVIHEEGPTMRIGRARQNGIGYKIYDPQMQCGGLQPERTLMELSLREDGMIKWHNWYDWDIMIPYKNADGRCKPLSQIRAELVDMVWPRLLRHNIKNTVLNLLPIYGDIRQIYINKQIQKTYKENIKQFVHIAKQL